MPGESLHAMLFYAKKVSSKNNIYEKRIKHGN